MILDFDDFDVRDRFYLIEEKTDQLRRELESFSPEQQRIFNEINAQAYIFHDATLDGCVVTSDEIFSVFSQENEDIAYIRSRALQEIRNHRKKLYEVINQSLKTRLSGTIYRSLKVTLEDILSCHENLFFNTPKKNAGKFRTQLPIHVPYFHNVAEPKEIKEKLTELCQQTIEPEFRAQHPINQASIFHFKFMQIHPFLEASGKVGRLIMNGFLLQGGYELAIIHGTERQRYYEALTISPEEVRLLILDNLESSIDSRLNFIKNSNYYSYINKTKKRIKTSLLSNI